MQLYSLMPHEVHGWVRGDAPWVNSWEVSKMEIQVMEIPKVNNH